MASDVLAIADAFTTWLNAAQETPWPMTFDAERALLPDIPEGDATREELERVRVFVTPISCEREIFDRATNKNEPTLQFAVLGYVQRTTPESLIDLADAIGKRSLRTTLTYGSSHRATCKESRHVLLYSPALLHQRRLVLSIVQLVFSNLEDAA